MSHLAVPAEQDLLEGGRRAPTSIQPAPQFRSSIIMPLFNNVAYTAKSVVTLVENTNFSDYELILVDNGSTDATDELLATLEGDVTIIRNSENLGFAKASNQGAAAAKSDYLLFLNNDTELLPGWLPPLIRILDTQPDVGAVGAKLLYPDGTVQHAGMVIAEDLRQNLPLIPLHVFVGCVADHPQVNVPSFGQVVTGACMLVRRSAFEAVGGFDEGYWNGFEDMDLCFKLGKAGWRVAYEPASCLIHHGSVSGPERFAKETQNRLRLEERWLGQIVPDILIRDSGQAEIHPLHVDATVPSSSPDVSLRLGELLAPNLSPINPAPASHPQPAPTRIAPTGTDITAEQLVTLVSDLAQGANAPLAELIRDRVTTVEDRRLLELLRAGRDVCWLDDDPRPLVTIAIPTFNRGQLIVDRAIRSALAQTYTNIEVLVVGDHCDEATENAVRSVDDPRLRFVNLPARGLYPEDRMHRWMVAGTAPANAAIELAHGTWITQCDDDDELTPDHVDVLLAAARSQQVEMIFSKATMETAPGTWSEIGSEPLRVGQVTHGSVLYSLGLRHFRYSTTAWRLEEPGDWNMWRRMSDAGVKIGFLPKVTFVHYLEDHLRGDPTTMAAAAPPSALHVQLGCGPNKLPGWVNIDAEPTYAPDIVWDLRQGVPLEPNSADVIYSEHFFEHIELNDGLTLLRSCLACLQPGGTMRIAMPDLADAVRRYLSPEWRDQDWLRDPVYAYIDTPAHMLNVSMRAWEHRYLYDEEDLLRRMTQCGFVDLRRMSWGESDIAALRGRETRPESVLLIEGSKPYAT
jgi:GT2 family glycosyltransferase/predicted SAM-dependent methyltransferase